MVFLMSSKANKELFLAQFEGADSESEVRLVVASLRIARADLLCWKKELIFEFNLMINETLVSGLYN